MQRLGWPGCEKSLVLRGHCSIPKRAQELGEARSLLPPSVLVHSIVLRVKSETNSRKLGCSHLRGQQRRWVSARASRGARECPWAGCAGTGPLSGLAHTGASRGGGVSEPRWPCGCWDCQRMAAPERHCPLRRASGVNGPWRGQAFCFSGAT